MKIGIKHRLFLVLLAATGLVALGMFAIMQWSIDRGFLQYVNTLEQERLESLAGELEQAYAAEGSWESLRERPEELLRLTIRSLSPELISPEQRRRLERRLERRLHAGERRGEAPPPPPQSFERRVVLLDAGHRPVLGPISGVGQEEMRPLRQDGRVVGYLGLLPRKGLTDLHQLRFVRQQKLALALVAGLMLLVSALLALPVANRLVRPIRALAVGTRRLSAGSYVTRVPVDSGDELGQLARDFNALALVLEKNEQARRQWVADISHELRTPLSILRGEIEALQDGVRTATPEALGSLHGEVMRLGRLVDDLYQLAISDLGALSYRKESVDLGRLLAEALEPFRGACAAKAISLECEQPPGPVLLFADAERMRQLLDNLLENSLRYTDAGGRIEVRLESGAGVATLHLLDSAPGVPEAEIGRLFERLYRVESSRSRATGGAGLGLSICRNIVEAHDGDISARPSPQGGLWVTVTLPTAEMKR